MVTPAMRFLIREHGWAAVLAAVADLASETRAERADDRGGVFGQLADEVRGAMIELDAIRRRRESDNPTPAPK